MNNALSTRILLRKDTAEQWEQFNPILLNGELAVVIENDGNIRLKVGDGSRSYQQLPFINHTAIETNSIVQGMQAFARPYGMAGGFRVSADSQFAQAFGINATTNGDNYSFVWNGDNDLTHDTYTSHGSGTFNVNPINGLSGFFIDDRNLSDVIYTEVERKSTTYVDGEKKDLSVFQISFSDYMEGVMTSSLLSDAIYIVSSDVRYMFGERITDLAEPELSSDAATKNYVDTELAKIDVTEQLGPLSSAISSKIAVAYGKDGEFEPADISVRIVGLQEYAGIVSSDELEDGILYSISGLTSLNAFGQPVQNVADPSEETDASNKRYVDQQALSVLHEALENGSNIYINGVKSELSVQKLTEEEYHALTPEERAISNMMYVVEYENANMYGSRITNVADPEQNSDATTKKYVDQKFSTVKVPTRTSELVNDSGFLTAHQSLDDYYDKTQVNEISANLAGKSVVRLSVPENGIQENLSVLNIVKLTKSKYQQLESIGQILSSSLYVIEVEDNDVLFGGNSFTC